MPHKTTDHEANRGKRNGSARRSAKGGESRIDFDVVAGDRPNGRRRRNPNSKAKADRGVPYERIRRPNDADEAIDAIDVWARYLHQWGVRVDHEFHGLYLRLQAAGTPTTHLDPPPEPFTTD